MRLEDIVQKNVETIVRIEEAASGKRKHADHVADAIASFCGSGKFALTHLFLFGGWILWNSVGTVPRELRFDPPPFPYLALVAALEVIFLTTFILISQNHQQRLAENRNHLDLQINLLAEQETSHLLRMMKRVLDHLGLADDVPGTGLEGETDVERLTEQIREGQDA